MSDEKLIRMANQIATFFASQPGSAADGFAAHINDNWAPPMRAKLLAHIADGGEGLLDIVKTAGPKIRPAQLR
jgi:formate dehydrogenase subunit delta